MIEGCLSALFELVVNLLLLGVGWVVIKIITLGNGHIGERESSSDQPQNVRYFSQEAAQGIGCVSIIGIGIGIYFLLRLLNPQM